MTSMTRTKRISPRRARAMAEAVRIGALLADLEAENARRAAEAAKGCPMCAAFDESVSS